MIVIMEVIVEAMLPERVASGHETYLKIVDLGILSDP